MDETRSARNDRPPGTFAPPEEMQARLQAIISAAMDAIISINSEQRIVLFNASAERVFGLSAAEALGQHIDRLIPARYREAHVKHVENFGRTGTTARRMGALGALTGVRANGEEFPIEASISQVEVGGQRFYTVILRDMTEQRQREETARAQLAALEAADNPIVITERSGSIQWVNPAFERLTGFAAAEVQGQNPRLLKSGRHHDTRFYQNMWKTILEGRVWRGELYNQRKDGTSYPEEMTITPVRDQTGTITHFVAVKQDISERKQAEETRTKLERDLRIAHHELERRVEARTADLREAVAELERISYSMIHDLRGPLRAIQSFGGILQEDRESRLSERGLELLAKMRTAASRMDHLVCDALNYTRVTRGNLTLASVDARALVCGIIETYPNLAPPLAEVTVSPDWPLVVANEALLTQCLSQLLSNAVKFSKPGRLAKVLVKAETVEHSKVQIVVEDNGVGIAPEYQEKIFGMFQRLSNTGEGTGMGLAIVRKAVERMHGRVGVESEPGQGSRFWIELQVA